MCRIILIFFDNWIQQDNGFLIAVNAPCKYILFDFIWLWAHNTSYLSDAIWYQTLVIHLVIPLWIIISCLLCIHKGLIIKKQMSYHQDFQKLYIVCRIFFYLKVFIGNCKNPSDIDRRKVILFKIKFIELLTFKQGKI